MAENIKVVCRVRPLNESELSKGSQSVLAYPGDGKTAVAIAGKTFNFDHVIQPHATQLEVYELVAKPIVSSVLNGYNGTIFAYGQTSSGKTFTMEGVLNDPVYQGIIPRIIHDIFNHIYQMDENLEFHIKVSYFEIYMEKIRDLLDVTKTNLSVHEDKDRVPYVKGATERFVSNPEEVFDVIDEGKSNRHVAVTNMNEHSSRSHSVFMVTLKQENVETQKKLHGKLYLVDLAGSEKVAKTGAEGTVLDEAKNINKSLSSLGNVINSLVEGSAHVPYRDSKLTRILQESLGGNARTTMVICCSPASFNESETKSTLLFGMRAKTIKNCVQVNEELTAEEWRRRYEREKERNRRLKCVIAGMEIELSKWRNGERVEKQDWFISDKIDDIALNDDDALATSIETSTIGNSAPGGPPSSLLSTNKRLPSTMNSSSILRSESVNVEDLYKQLDDKDEELGQTLQDKIRLQNQIDEYEELIRQLRVDIEKYQQDFSNQQSMNDASKEEVKEVLQALEELAMNYDAKAQELEVKTRELDDIHEKINEHKGQVTIRESEVHHWKDLWGSTKKRYSEMIISLSKDIHEMAVAMVSCDEASKDQQASPVTWTGVTFSSGDKLEEEFTLVRLHTGKLKSEIKSLILRQKQLEDERIAQLAQHKQDNDKAKELQIRLCEFERKVEHQTQKLEEIEANRRKLEDSNDHLRNEVATLKASANLEGRDNVIISGQETIRKKLDEEFLRLGEEYNQQVAKLRDEIASKDKIIDEMRDANQHLTLQFEQTQNENKKLVDDYEMKSTRLDDLEKQIQKGEQTKADLKGLEDTVFKELQTLHNLRRLFVQDMRNRIKKSVQIREMRQKKQQQNANNGTEPVDQALVISEDENADNESSVFRSGSAAQKQKINFLENNLEQLTKVHKQLVKDNAELRCEVPKLEKRLKTVMDRVKSLEESLKEAKETAVRDRRRYQSEVERIKEHVRARNNRRNNAPNIVKPIRAGQGPSNTSIVGQPLQVIGMNSSSSGLQS